MMYNNYMGDNSTNINDLPTNPTGGGSIGGNVGFSVSEQGPSQGQGYGSSSSVSLDQTTINQIVSGLQQASSTGVTQLQSRDIPRTTENLTQDEQIQPNFIPKTSNTDYITEQEENEDIINNYNYKKANSDSLDDLYDELQTPLLIAVLYFLFQLPFFRKFLFKYGPALFAKDGNINLYGYVFTSVLFGLIYYILSKIMVQFNRF